MPGALAAAVRQSQRKLFDGYGGARPPRRTHGTASTQEQSVGLCVCMCVGALQGSDGQGAVPLGGQ